MGYILMSWIASPIPEQEEGETEHEQQQRVFNLQLSSHEEVELEQDAS